MSAKVIIIGNLGKNPETRINANNNFVASFSIAENSVQKSATGEKLEKTNWYNITATGKQAQILAEHAKKGDPLYVEGKLDLNPWTDRDGNNRFSADVLLQDFRFLGKFNRADEQTNGGNNVAVNRAAGNTVTRSGAIPAAAAHIPDEDFSGDNFPTVM